jgi:hypothetical protein
MDKHIDRIKKTADEISEKRDELKAQKKINAKDLSIADELFNMRLRDASSLQEIESVSEAVNYERRALDRQTRDNQDRVNEISQEADDYIDDLENNVRVYKQMEKTSNLVNVRPHINEAESRIDELNDVKKQLEKDSYNSSYVSELSPYIPIDSEYTEQQSYLADQYSNETDLNKKETIRALSELTTLESSLNLSDGDPNIPQMGGRYGDIKGSLKGYEAHHIPPKSVSDVNMNDLPAIYLTKEDHALTASYRGKMSSKPTKSPFQLEPPKDTRTYRDRLISQINNGNYADAFRNEVYEIKHLFGDKYDGAIKQVIEANRNYLKNFGNPRVVSDDFTEQKMARKLKGE